MNIRQRKTAVGRAGNRRAVEAPLNPQRVRAGSRDGNGNVAAALDSLVRKRAADRSGNEHWSDPDRRRGAHQRVGIGSANDPICVRRNIQQKSVVLRYAVGIVCGDERWRHSSHIARLKMPEPRAVVLDRHRGLERHVIAAARDVGIGELLRVGVGREHRVSGPSV